MFDLEITFNRADRNDYGLSAYKIDNAKAAGNQKSSCSAWVSSIPPCCRVRFQLTTTRRIWHRTRRLVQCGESCLFLPVLRGSDFRLQGDRALGRRNTTRKLAKKHGKDHPGKPRRVRWYKSLEILRKEVAEKNGKKIS